MAGNQNSGNRIEKRTRDMIKSVMDRGWLCIDNYLKSSAATKKDKAWLAMQICKRQIANVTKETGNKIPRTVINNVFNHLPTNGQRQQQSRMGVDTEADTSLQEAES